MDDACAPPNFWHVDKINRRGVGMQKLLPALGGIDIFKGCAVFRGDRNSRDAAQRIERDVRARAGHNANAQSERAGCQRGEGHRPAETRARGSQVAGNMADDEVVHGFERDEGKHEGIILWKDER